MNLIDKRKKTQMMCSPGSLCMEKQPAHEIHLRRFDTKDCQRNSIYLFICEEFNFSASFSRQEPSEDPFLPLAWILLAKRYFSDSHLSGPI